MKIEKIKNYNQKLLAILGTLLSLLVLIGLLFVVYEFISEIQRNNRYNDNQIEGILSDEKIEELQKENKRQQIVSYENPRLVDTLKLKFIIPVSYKTLNEPEDSSNLLGLLSSTGTEKFSKSKRDKRYSKNYYGNYSNLLIYDSKLNHSEKLFTERVNFNNIRIEYLENDILILIEVAEKDTYKDGVINLEDLKSLYIYSFNKKILRKVQKENTDIVNYKFVDRTNEMIVVLGNDYNKNGKFEEWNEPTYLYKYEYEKDLYTKVINTKLHSELQKKLESIEKN